MPKLNAVLEVKGMAAVSVPSSCTVLEAVRTLSRNGVGSVLVVDHHQLVGIFTERDAVRRVLGMDRRPRETLVSAVMSRDVVVGHPDDTVLEAMQRMAKRRLRHLPVVLEGRVLGVVSIGNLARCAAHDLDLSVGDLAAFIHGAAVKHDSDWPTAFPPASNYAEEIAPREDVLELARAMLDDQWNR